MPAPLDPIVEAAFALTGRPGAYAALIGSGVSTGLPANLETWYLGRCGPTVAHGWIAYFG